MAQNYVVNYDINVFAEDAVQAIGRFTMASEQLKKASAPFQKLNQKINSLKANISSLGKVKAEVFINTKQAEAKIDRLQGKLERLMATARSLNMTVGAGGGSVAGATSRGRAASRTTTVATGGGNGRRVSSTLNRPSMKDPVVQRWERLQSSYAARAKLIRDNAAMFGWNYKTDPLYQRYMEQSRKAGTRAFARQNPGVMNAWTAARENFVEPTPVPRGRARGGTRVAPVRARYRSLYPNALGYKMLGATPMDVGGIGAVDILKGMGIAYGIAGLGTGIGSAISSATEYDNIMQTTKNILGSHDNRDNFEGRFHAMERNVRQIGVKTKFTAPEVADASRFLAMAGLNIEEINSAIRPITDIALIADTDLGETADVVTNIMTAYGMGANQMRDIADKMTMTFTMSNTTLPEMAESYKYFASIARANNWSFDETTGMIGILGDAGLKGSHAGTTIRQLMNNLLKPSKSQKAALDRFGVTARNADGTLRSPYAIFKDLAEAGAQSSTFDLFRVTAAQGGVSLMQSVEKWDKIIEENRKSSGISTRLAEAKQNTVQGLWAQTTSMFTEGAMQAFEAVRPQIADMLKSVTEWLGTDDARSRIKAFAEDILNFARILGDFTKTIMDFYEKFRKPIMLFLELQLRMWPVIYGLRVLKSAWYAVLGAIRLTQGFGAFINGFVTLAANIRRSTAAMMAFRRANASMGWGGALNFGAATMAHGKEISPAVWERYQRMYGGRGGAMGGMGRGMGVAPGVWGSIRTGIGGIVGGGLGYAIGNSIDEENGGMWGSIIGGIGGGLLAAPGVATALFSNPIGWVAAIGLAVGGAAYYFHKYHEAIDVATQANNDFISSTNTINGINYSEHATMADKYLSIVYNKQLDTNRAIGEHINLMREQLGLMKQAEQEIKDATPFKESNKETFENASAAFGKFSNKDEWIAAIGGFAIDLNDPQMAVERRKWQHANGHDYYHLMFNGVDYGEYETKNAFSQIAASRLLYSLGRDTSEGSQLRELIDSYQARILQAATPQDFYAVIKDLTSYAQSLQYYKGSEYWNMSQIGENSMATNRMSYHYVTALQKGLYDQFMWNNPQTALATQLADLQKILTAHETQQEVTTDLLGNFLLHGGIDIFNSQRYGAFGSDQFMKYFGWYDNQWHSGTYTYLNQQTGKLEQVTLTADEARRHFLTFHQQIIDMVNKLSPKIQPYFNSFVNSPIWGFGDPNGSQSGSEKTLNGVKYTWQNGKWVPESGHGPLVDMTDAEMQQALQRQNPGGNTPVIPRVGGGTGGANQSNYKSHYNNNSAAPKQVIVKIENLMNVKSIDLTNPDNAAVINDVKQQLTQALIDVVHDFDETYHG